MNPDICTVGLELIQFFKLKVLFLGINQCFVDKILYKELFICIIIIDNILKL